MGCTETTGAQVGRILPDARRASPRVSAKSSDRRSYGARGGGVISRGGGGGGSEEGGVEGGERKNTKWEWVVELVQTALWYGVLSEEAAWQAVVLIPEGGVD